MSAEQWDKDAEHGEDFWRQGDWDDLHNGQLIAAVWPSGARIGKLRDPGAGTLYLRLNEQGNVASVDSLRQDGAALFVEATPPTPPLPTEPGYYRVSGNNEGAGGTLQLDVSDQWWWVGNEYKPNPEKIPTESVREFAPLTRVEPVPVTANRVLDRLREVWSTNMDSTLDNIEQVRAEFGVTL